MSEKVAITRVGWCPGAGAAAELPPSLAAQRGGAGAAGNRACVLSKDLNANLAALTADFQKATAEKLKCQQEADATNRVITLANRYRTERRESPRHRMSTGGTATAAISDPQAHRGAGI